MGMRQLSFSICQAHLVQRKSSDTDLSRTRLYSACEFTQPSLPSSPLSRPSGYRWWLAADMKERGVASRAMALGLPCPSSSLPGKMSECVH
ncbi:hypothetical protein BO83DRAFT_383092 [Aspergillus eucalypticola CBS 122712]|uniref:Uncharacterized protein n=1 Tax=Aspergillus eucalypticola (strain CBS 122712 / IBT 29274) TaxID=1448314 RepID=A0A317UQI9_ASPEC|nr:uncharacterized protein BO83DRAFT_383092 [Aspergillus eucalypticola CBS 122712]PWY62847.1 hypothetical protein BO83DRAFT_383092 [Aspergillus eucalypticola CBS 122712]